MTTENELIALIAMLDEGFKELERRRNALAWKTFVIGLLLGYIVGMVIWL